MADTPQTLPADFFDKQQPAAPKTLPADFFQGKEAAPNTLPADFFQDKAPAPAPAKAAEPTLWEKTKKLGGDLLQSSLTPMTTTLARATGDKNASTTPAKDIFAGPGKATRELVDRLDKSGSIGHDIAGFAKQFSFPGEIVDQGLQAAGGALDFISSPLGAGAAMLPGAPAAVQATGEAALGTTMVNDAGHSIKEAYEHPTSENQAQALVSTVMAALPAVHGLKKAYDMKGAPVAPGSEERLPSPEQIDQGTTAAADVAAEHIVKQSSPQQVAPTPQTLPEVENPQQPQERPITPPTSAPVADPPAAPSEPKAPEPAPALDAPKPSEELPRDLAGAKPRYNYGGKSFDLEFESDVDKAAYISAQRLPSRRDADYVAHVEKVTGLSPNEIRAKGLEIRDGIKSQAIDAEPGTLKIERTITKPKEVEALPEEHPLSDEVEPHADEREDHSPTEPETPFETSPHVGEEPKATETPTESQRTEEAAPAVEKPAPDVEKPAPAVEAAPDSDFDTTTKDGKRVTLGGYQTVKARTGDGTRARIQHAIIEAGDAVTSHDFNGEVNPDYDGALQLRDRTRAASGDQLRRTAAKIDPLEVSNSYLASTGAPILRDDLHTISGNNRTNALRMMYEQHPEVADRYRAGKAEELEGLGFPSNALDGYKNPVHVRLLRDEKVDPVSFAEEANTPTVAKMSASEVAAVDAPKLTGDLLKQFKPSEDGDITAASNRDFVRQYIEKVVPENDRAGLQTADGTLSQEGVTRIRNAVFHSAYGDPATLDRLAESTDSNIKNVTNGMLTAAPDFARLNSSIEAGESHPIDFRPDIAEAVTKLSDLKSTGTSVTDYLNQAHLFGDADISPEARSVLEFVDGNKRSKDRIGRFFTNLADAVSSLGDPRQDGIFGNSEVPSKQHVLASALENTQAQLDAIEKSKTDARNAQQQLLAAPGNATPEAEAGRPSEDTSGNQSNPQVTGEEATGEKPAASGAVEGSVADSDVKTGTVQPRGRRTGRLTKAQKLERDQAQMGLVGKTVVPYGGGRDVIQKVTLNPENGAPTYTVKGSDGRVRTHSTLIDPVKAPIGPDGVPLYKRKTQGGSVSPELLTLGVGHFLKDDVLPTARDAAKVMREAKDDFASIFAPAGRTESSQAQAHIIRENAAELARRDDIAEASVRVVKKYFDSQDSKANHDFMNRIETGQTQGDLHRQSIANQLRGLLDGRRKEVQKLGTGKLQGFYENYFPHIWDDPVKAAEVIQGLYRRNLEGSKAFLKERAVPTIQDGLNAGLKLASDNPVELVLRKIHEMDKYITAHHMLQDSQDSGLLQLIEANQDLPEGWKFIDDPIARVYANPAEAKLQNARDAGQTWIGGEPGASAGNLPNMEGPKGAQGSLLPGYQGKAVSDPGAVAGAGLEAPEGPPVIAGRFAAPEPVARVFNNHLSPGLRERSGIFRAVLGVSNVLNQAQLGFSAFHLMFTSAEAAYSRFSLGIHQAAHGEVVAGLKTSASAPLAPFTNIIKGDKVLKEWFKPGSQGGELGRVVDAVLKAGGRARMDGYYRTNMIDHMMGALRAGNLPGAVWRAPFAAVEAAAKPIAEYIVPRQKLGVFADMARAEFARLPETATGKDAQAALTRAWDSVDNRMGQMVYSNLFWHRVAKDIGMVSVRSMGWTLGTIREGLGGVKDLTSFGRDKLGGAMADQLRDRGAVTPDRAAALKDRASKADFSYRASYVVGAPMLMALAGSVAYGLMHGGAPPPTIKDAFFPTNADGDRYNIPGYGKDAYEWGHNPLKTAGAKVNPLFPLVKEMVTNKDYFGHEISHADDPLMRRVLDRAEHAGKNLVPFGAQKFMDDGVKTKDKLLPMVGITRAPKSLDQQE